MPFTFTAKQARENVEKFNERQKQEQEKKARAYVSRLCQVIAERSDKGETSILAEEMEYISDHAVAIKILEKELGYEVEKVPGKPYIRISWPK